MNRVLSPQEQARVRTLALQLMRIAEEHERVSKRDPLALHETGLTNAEAYLMLGLAAGAVDLELSAALEGER